MGRRRGPRSDVVAHVSGADSKCHMTVRCEVSWLRYWRIGPFCLLLGRVHRPLVESVPAPPITKDVAPGMTATSTSSEAFPVGNDGATGAT
jgi:hypothetical protein